MPSSVTALLVGLFAVSLLNLAFAAHLLLSRRPGERALLAAAGPLGIALFALAWAISSFTPKMMTQLQTIAGFAAAIAVFGFALELLTRLSIPQRRIVLAVSGASFVCAAGVLWFIARAADVNDLKLYLTRALCIPLLVTVVLSSALLRRSGEKEERSFATRMLFAGAAGLGLYLALSAAALLIDEDSLIDPAMAALLAAEGLTVVHVLRARPDGRAAISRIVTHGLLGIAVALAAAEGVHRLGFTMSGAQLTVMVAIVLFAAVILLTAGDALQRRVERLFFPAQAALRDHLNASRSEAATLRRRLSDVERKAVIGELAARVAHEVKNPLAAVRGYAQLMDGAVPNLPADVRESFEKGLRIIREESDRIDARIRELLSVHQVRKASREAQRTELNRLVLEAIAAAEGDAGAVRFQVQLDGEAGEVEGDADELRGAVLNLLRNAVEACVLAGGRTIQISTRNRGDQVLIQIIDEGMGVSSADAARLFTPFFTTRANGTGLGLCIARSAVEAAGGSLSLKNRSEGRGAEAQVTLLRAQPLNAPALRALESA